MSVNPPNLAEIARCAWRIRRYAVRMGEVQGQGYVGQALGYADVLATAYGHALNFRADDPDWDGRDRFLLSHGHYAIAFYAALIEAGIVPETELETYGSDDMALGLRHRGNPAFVYNSMSDGELDEGSTWEAAMSASHHGLGNLICIVDINNQQADGPSTQVMGFEPLADKWSAFGWHVQRVDGNHLPAVVRAFDTARQLTDARPRVILCDTLMGKGVPFLERRDKNHFIRVDPPEWQQALDVLDANRP
jgi:transketolase